MLDPRAIESDLPTVGDIAAHMSVALLTRPDGSQYRFMNEQSHLQDSLIQSQCLVLYTVGSTTDQEYADIDGHLRAAVLHSSPGKIAYHVCILYIQ